MPLQTVQHITIDEAYAGQRIDNYLSRVFSDSVPKSLIYKIIRKGNVRVNKGRVTASYRLQDGDVVRIPPVRQQLKEAPRVPCKLIEAIEKRILFEDDKLLVINKPSGIPVHGGSGQKLGVMDVVKAMRPQLKFIELAHRLDKGTSGCLLFAKSRQILLELHDLFKCGDINKRYLALTRGRWLTEEVHVDQPLLKNQQSSGERMVKVSSLGKPAQTNFKVQKTFTTASLVEAKLLTGRTHQIRVHAAYKHHPLAGDDKYGDDLFNKEMKLLGLKRLFLHAYHLSFYLKSLGKRVIIEAPLDTDLLDCLHKLEKNQ